MKEQSLKTKLLNKIRVVCKLRFVENFLVKRTQGKNLNNIFVKLIPNYDQYPKGSIRQVNRLGVNFQLDISDYMEYVIYYGVNTEPKGKLFDLIEDGSTVLDVGANIGETLLQFASINTNGMNIGFEPVPYIYDRLQKNISLNNLSSLKIENLAISDRKETLSFKMPNNQNSGGVRMRKKENKNEYNADLNVQAITLDEYLSQNNIQKVDMIKIDVEGFELNVLKGAENTLANFRPKMFIEIDDQMLKEQNSSAESILKWLESKNYKLLNGETNQPIDLKDDFTNCHFDVLTIPV